MFGGRRPARIGGVVMAVESHPLAWQDGTQACLGVRSTLFFQDGRGDSTWARRAKELCQTCPLIEPCREYAITYDEHFGVWGGMSERQRRVERRRRRLIDVTAVAA